MDMYPGIPWELVADPQGSAKHTGLQNVGIIFRYPLEGTEESQITVIEDTQAAVKNLKNTTRIQSAVTLREILLGVQLK